MDANHGFFDDRDDAVLLAAARSGDARCADVLWIRIRPTAVNVARRITGNAHDADDLASEALTKVFAAIADGQGPTQSLLPYVCTTMRNLHVTALRRQLRSGVGLVELDAERDLALAATEPDSIESDLVANAFKNLPARWRHVLWASLVEGRGGSEIADDLGIRPAAVHALKSRALEGLRQQYLTEHAQPGQARECSTVHHELAAVARGRVRRSADVEEIWRHLRGCAHCAEGYREISAMNSRIGALLGPAAAGMVGFLPRHSTLGPLSALRAAAPVTQWGIAAGVAGALAVGVTAGTAAQRAPEPLAAASHQVAPAAVHPTTPTAPRHPVATAGPGAARRAAPSEVVTARHCCSAACATVTTVRTPAVPCLAVPPIPLHLVALDTLTARVPRLIDARRPVVPALPAPPALPATRAPRLPDLSVPTP